VGRVFGVGPCFLLLQESINSIAEVDGRVHVDMNAVNRNTRMGQNGMGINLIIYGAIASSSTLKKNEKTLNL
jgi:hypothetical protein